MAVGRDAVERSIAGLVEGDVAVVRQVGEDLLNVKIVRVLAVRDEVGKLRVRHRKIHPVKDVKDNQLVEHQGFGLHRGLLSRIGKAVWRTTPLIVGILVIPDTAIRDVRITLRSWEQRLSCRGLP